MKMPSKRQYDLVLDDGPDSKIPLHNEDAFQHGINFHAKYIGTLDVPRPGSRVEIVAAMRRIRYEFKAKAVKKKKVAITISVDGVKVVLQKKNRRVGKQQWTWDESRLIVLQHPIYRIFYVSHDSQDLKIFSYIARDSSTNVFRCNVFKAYKKSQAMNIVRTIGQAFEVCHRISLETATQNEEGNDAGSEKSSEDGNEETALQGSSMLEKQPVDSSPSENGTSTSTQSPEDAVKKTQQLIESLCLKPTKPPTAAVLSSSPVLTPSSDAARDDGSFGAYHRVQLLHQQLQLQTQQTQFIAAQVQHLKDQLAAETAARIEAQNRTHQLLVQNRELLAHISTLVNRLVQFENSADDGLSSDQQRSPKEILTLFDSSLSDASFLFMSASSSLSKPHESSLFHNTDCKPELKGSPDSGHKEMSSGSLALGSGDLIDGWFSTAEKNKTGNFNDRKILDIVPGLGTTNAVRPLTISGPSANGMTINDLFSQNKSVREGGDRQNEPLKIITPIPAQDASGNRLELNIAPKLDPPPRINRNSSRFCGPLILGGGDNREASGSSTAAVAAAAGSGKDLKPDNESGKRYSWETYTLSDKQNGNVKKDFNTQPTFFCDDVKKSPEKLLGSVLHVNGNNKSSNPTEAFHTPASSLHGLKGIKNRFAVHHQNSVESTAKLKLSFSDNE